MDACLENFVVTKIYLKCVGKILDFMSQHGIQPVYLNVNAYERRTNPTHRSNCITLSYNMNFMDEHKNSEIRQKYLFNNNKYREDQLCGSC